MYDINKILIVFILFFIATGCKTTQKSVRLPENKINMPHISKDVQRTISDLEKKASPNDNPENIIKRSFLYSHDLNSKPDYKKSLELMQRYIEKTPKENEFEFARYISSLLKKVVEQKERLEENKKLLRKGKKEKRLLIIQNNDLQKKINSLKKLDIRLEKQRLRVE